MSAPMIENYSFGAHHNQKCVNEGKDGEIEFSFRIDVHDRTKTDLLLPKHLDAFVEEMRKIADTSDWDISINGNIYFVFKKRQEHLYQQLKEKANELGYKLY